MLLEELKKRVDELDVEIKETTGKLDALLDERNAIRELATLLNQRGTPDTRTVQQKINDVLLQAPDHALRITQIIDAMPEEKEPTVRAQASSMVMNGKLVRVAAGVYALPLG